MNMQLLEWYYLIFELPLGLGLLYLAFFTVSGVTFGDADTDAGLDHDIDVDAHADVDLDHDADLSLGGGPDVHVDADADADSDADHDSESDSHTASPFVAALIWIGVGRMPLSLVLMILLISFGSFGFAAMRFQVGHPIEQAVVVALGVAVVASALITHYIALFLGRTIFSTAIVARRRHELLGSHGEALYDISDAFGMVVGRDDRGELFQVACKVEEGQKPLAKGSSVQLVAYTAKDRMFYVVPATSEKTPRNVVVPIKSIP
jgi:hypothetical protein